MDARISNWNTETSGQKSWFERGKVLLTSFLAFPTWYSNQRDTLYFTCITHLMSCTYWTIWVVLKFCMCRKSSVPVILVHEYPFQTVPYFLLCNICNVVVARGQSWGLLQTLHKHVTGNNTDGVCSAHWAWVPLLAGVSFHIRDAFCFLLTEVALCPLPLCQVMCPLIQSLLCVSASQRSERHFWRLLIADSSGNNNKRNQFLGNGVSQASSPDLIKFLLFFLVFFVGERVNRKNKPCSCTSWQ